MSLSTRIAIGPSRCLANTRSAMIAGAIIVTAATAAAHLVADSASVVLWLTTGAATLIASAMCMKSWIKPAGSRVYEVFISDRAVVSLRCQDEDTMPQTFELSDASMVWPGLAVLSLSPTLPLPSDRASRLLVRLRRRALDLAVVNAEMDADDGWRLHRFLHWAQHNGSRAAEPTPRDSLV